LGKEHGERKKMEIRKVKEVKISEK